jgi:hypothetical protein
MYWTTDAYVNVNDFIQQGVWVERSSDGMANSSQASLQPLVVSSHFRCCLGTNVLSNFIMGWFE